MSSLHVAALVAYDGTDYCGFQYQRNQPSIQGTLENGLHSLTGAHCRVIGSGRTDTGVHASGQVVSTQVPWRHSLFDLHRAWNAHLPPAIVVRRVAEVPEEFHARFSARRRTYCYAVYHNGDSRERQTTRHFPLTDRFFLYEKYALDLEQMRRAAQYLLGEHDFITFGRPPQGNNSVRTLFALDIRKEATVQGILGQSHHSGHFIIFTVTANAFLRQMVRNLVGGLLEVGRGFREAEDIERILMARDRSQCPPPAPAHGLTLQHVVYPDYPGLFS